MLHRVEEGRVCTFIDDEELARVQHLLYWCDECNAYHIRDASSKMNIFLDTLNQVQEVQDA